MWSKYTMPSKIDHKFAKFSLTLKRQRVFLVKIASKQPFLKAKWLVQNEDTHLLPIARS
jgi:hypothetical protein